MDEILQYAKFCYMADKIVQHEYDEYDLTECESLWILPENLTNDTFDCPFNRGIKEIRFITDIPSLKNAVLLKIEGGHVFPKVVDFI